MVSLQNLTHKFESKVLFENLNHSFNQGVHALIGKSGTGKTTLLRIIAGLISPTEGEAVCDGKVSVSFQDHVLFPWYTAKKNIEIVSDSETAKKLLDEFGLENDHNTFPAKLSGGMKSRVAIARALAYNADIILLDEPFAGLDTDTALKSLDIIKKHSKNKTVIISTHNLEIANMLDSVYKI